MKKVAVLLSAAKHVRFLVETNKSGSLSRMRDRDDMIGAFFISLLN